MTKYKFHVPQKLAEQYAAESKDKKAVNHKSFWEMPPTAKPMAELSRDDCRWPVANGNFCGARSGQGSYCPYHHDINYQRKQTKK